MMEKIQLSRKAKKVKSPKKRSKKKIIGYSLLGVLAALLVVGTILYLMLKPENHFTNVPVFNPGQGTESENDEQKTVQLKDPIFNILLIGSDQRKGQSIGHSDTMIVINVNLKDYEYNMLSIPRDSRVYLDGYGYTKLTSVQYILQAEHGSEKGIQEAVKAISSFTGIPINYYAETSFEGLAGIIDTLGGIDMNVPFDVNISHAGKGQVITAGTHSLDGKTVVDLVRERKSLAAGEFGRQQLQKEALVGIAKKALNVGTITKLPELVKKLDEFIIETNLSHTDILSMAYAVQNFKPNEQIKYHQLTGKSQSLYDDILQANNSQFVVDEEEMKKIVEEYFIN